MAAAVPAIAGSPGGPVAEVPVRPNTAGRLLRNVLLLAGGQIASWAFGLVWLVFVPRLLGAGPIGQFVIAISITAVLGNLVNQGAGTLLTREVARDHGRAPTLVGATLALRLACMAPAAVLMFGYIRLLHFGSEQSLVIWLATAVTLCASLTGALQAVFTGLERMEYLAYSNFIGNGLVSVLGIAVVLLGGRIVAILELDLCLTLLILALNLHWSRGLFQIAWKGALGRAHYILRAGLSYWIGGLFFTTYLWIDSVILTALVPVNVIGWYGVSVQLFTAILMIAGVLGTAWFPRLAAAHAIGHDTLKLVGRPAVETAIVLSLPVGAGIALTAGPLIHLVYGPSFYGAVPVLAVLAISIVPTFLNMLAYQVLLAEGRQVAWIKVVAVATLLNIGANLVLIPLFQARGNGAIGAALCLLATEVFESLGALALLSWLLHRGLLSRFLRTAVATVLMSIAVLAMAPYGLVLEVVTGVVAFVAFGWLLRLATADELAELRGLGARFRAKLGLGGTTA